MGGNRLWWWGKARCFCPGKGCILCTSSGFNNLCYRERGTPNGVQCSTMAAPPTNALVLRCVVPCRSRTHFCMCPAATGEVKRASSREFDSAGFIRSTNKEKGKKLYESNRDFMYQKRASVCGHEPKPLFSVCTTYCNSWQTTMLAHKRQWRNLPIIRS